MADEDPRLGGGQPEGIRYVFQGGHACVVAFRVGDVGPDPPHVTGPVQFSEQGHMEDHRETSEEGGVGGMGIPTVGNSYGGGGIRGDRGLHPKKAEYGRAIYYEAKDSGPLQAIGTEAGSLYFSEVVGIRGYLPSWVKIAGGGGGGWGGGEEKRRGSAGGEDGQ